MPDSSAQNMEFLNKADSALGRDALIAKLTELAQQAGAQFPAMVSSLMNPSQTMGQAQSNNPPNAFTGQVAGAVGNVAAELAVPSSVQLLGGGVPGAGSIVKGELKGKQLVEHIQNKLKNGTTLNAAEATLVNNAKKEAGTVPKASVPVVDTIANTAKSVAVNGYAAGGEVDFSKYKKMHSNDDTTTLHHPAGHQIRIAHSKLSAEHRAKLDALPKFAEGGEVINTDILSMDPKAFEGKPTLEDSNRQFAADLMTAPSGPMPAAAAPVAPEIAPTNINMGAPAMGQQAPLPNQPIQAAPAQNDQIAGLQNEAAAIGAQGKEEMAIAQQQQQKAMDLMAEFQNKTATINQDISNVTHDLMNGHIDPNHFWNSKSDLGKASTAIGLILGGIGGAGTGQENPALKFLNSQIDKDIEAQKANASIKSNLLSHLTQQFGNEKDAMMVMKAMHADVYSAKLAEAAAKSKDPIAKARAQQAIGQIKASSQQLIAGVAAEQSINQALASGAPFDQVSPYMNEKQRDRAVPGWGLAATNEGAKIFNNDTLPNYEASKTGLAQLKQFANTPSSKFSPKDRAMAENLQTQLIGRMRVILTGPGAVNEGEREAMKNVIANPTDFFSVANAEKIGLLESALEKDMEARARQQGLKVPAAMKFKPIK